MSTLKVSTISPLGTDSTKTITLGESAGVLQAATAQSGSIVLQELKVEYQ